MHNIEGLLVVVGVWLLALILTQIVKVMVIRVTRRATAEKWQLTNSGLEEAVNTDSAVKATQEVVWFVRILIHTIAVISLVVWGVTMLNPRADGRVGDVKYAEPDATYTAPAVEEVHQTNAQLQDEPGDAAMEEAKVENDAAMNDAISLFRSQGQGTNNTNRSE